jgi:signal transduction histidine kinase
VEKCDEDPFPRANGELDWIRWEIHPWRTGKGEMGGIIIFSEIITARKRAEAQLMEAHKLESVGRLAGGIAHEFNNLLTVINGYSRFLLDRLNPADPLHSFAAAIRTSGERAAGLTQQLLAFGRKQVFRPAHVDVNTTVRALAEMLQPLIGENITLATKLDLSAGAVFADPDQLQQVLLNLVLNARDAMPKGGRIEIASANVEVDKEGSAAGDTDASPGRYVSIAVTDNGCGMDEKTRQQLFEPFFTTKEVGRGSGLGLAAVYGIVRQSGGWIDVRSTLGTGTTFNVFLPCASACPATPGRDIA